jgi:low affinity Fe/Cu permease
MPNNKTSHSRLTRKFQKFADKVSKIAGSPWWFIFSIVLVVLWLPTGLFLGFGEIWHLLINTTTTILTFLMIALLHASQNRWEGKIERMQKREESDIEEIKQGISRGYEEVKSEEKVSSIH